MRKKFGRNPLTGLRVPIAPTREEIKSDLLANIKDCIEKFAITKQVGYVVRYKRLSYRLRDMFGEDAPPLY